MLLRKVARELRHSSRNGNNGLVFCACSSSFSSLSSSSSDDDDNKEEEGGKGGEGSEDKEENDTSKVEMRHASRKNLVSKSWEYRKGEPWGWLYDATPRKETIHNFLSQKNSILSDRVKTKMYLDHKKDPVKYSSENLAKEYMVREQRIMAILALKRREAEWIKNRSEEHTSNSSHEQ